VRNELSAEPAATYLLRKFVELNESYAEELERLRPGLWNELQAAVAGKTNALDAQGNLIQTLNLQDRYVRYLPHLPPDLFFTQKQHIQVFGPLCLRRASDIVSNRGQ